MATLTRIKIWSERNLVAEEVVVDGVSIFASLVFPVFVGFGALCIFVDVELQFGRGVGITLLATDFGVKFLI